MLIYNNLRGLICKMARNMDFPKFNFQREIPWTGSTMRGIGQHAQVHGGPNGGADNRRGGALPMRRTWVGSLVLSGGGRGG
jgi:hypothetical protein